MYVQWFVKGIGSRDAAGNPGLQWAEAKAMMLDGDGITSNWWRNKPDQCISPREVEAILTEHNLERHVHDYDGFGHETPFISVAAGSVERDALLRRNSVYSAVDTALDFATDAGNHPGCLFYGWIVTSLNQAVELSSVAEAIRDLNVYHRWSPFQLEGEVTAKIHIPANQIQRVEWWDLSSDTSAAQDSCINPRFVAPAPILNMREHF